MSIGIVIKNIRLNKNIKAVDLYRSILTKPAFIKFEAGDSDTTVNKFLIILERLNITLEEFERIYKQKNNRDFYYVNHYMKYFYQRNLVALETLAIEANRDYVATNNEKFKHYHAIILLLIDYLTDRKGNEKQVEILKQYLINCEVWGYYEITLFTNALIYFSNDFIDSVYNRVKKNFILNTGLLIRHRNEIAILLFNIIEKKILDQDKGKLNYYLSELLLLQKNALDNMYVQTMIKYFDCIITAILNDNFNQQTAACISKITDFLDFIELHTKSNQCKMFLHKIEKLYKTQ